MTAGSRLLTWSVETTMSEVTPPSCTGALGTWQLQEYPDMVGWRTMECPWKQTTGCRGGCGSALQPRVLWEGDRREAKVRTGLGKTHRPGSQGGLRKRGPRWNEAPTSPLERASAGNAPPTVVRAAALSRLSSAPRQKPSSPSDWATAPLSTEKAHGKQSGKTTQAESGRLDGPTRMHTGRSACAAVSGAHQPSFFERTA
jgi:hypothetical protein